MKLSERILEIAEEKKLIKPKDLVAEKIPTVYLSRLVKQGKLLQVAYGFYALPETQFDENQSLIEFQNLVPKGVFCLLSALQFHNLTTQNPFQVWLAVERNAAVPRLRSVQNRIFRINSEMFDAGIEEHQVEGGIIRVYSPAKTVANCFKQGVKLEELKVPKNQVFDTDKIKKVSSWSENGVKLLQKKYWYLISVLSLATEPVTLKEMLTFLSYKNRTTFTENYLKPLRQTGLIKMTSPEKPTDPENKYVITEAGKLFLTAN